MEEFKTKKLTQRLSFALLIHVYKMSWGIIIGHALVLGTFVGLPTYLYKH